MGVVSIVYPSPDGCNLFGCSSCATPIATEDHILYARSVYSMYTHFSVCVNITVAYNGLVYCKVCDKQLGYNEDCGYYIMAPNITLINN